VSKNVGLTHQKVEGAGGVKEREEGDAGGDLADDGLNLARDFLFLSVYALFRGSSVLVGIDLELPSLASLPCVDRSNHNH